MCIDFNKENSKKVLNLKLVIMLEYQNIKICFEIIFPIGSKLAWRGFCD